MWATFLVIKTRVTDTLYRRYETWVTFLATITCVGDTSSEIQDIEDILGR